MLQYLCEENPDVIMREWSSLPNERLLGYEWFDEIREHIWVWKYLKFEPLKSFFYVAFGAKFGIFFFRFRDTVANFICLKKLTNLSQRAMSSKASKFQWHRIKRLVTFTISENSIKTISVSLKEHRKKKKPNLKIAYLLV